VGQRGGDCLPVTREPADPVAARAAREVQVPEGLEGRQRGELGERVQEVVAEVQAAERGPEPGGGLWEDGVVKRVRTGSR
jgi:hypothetical protein